MSDIWNKAKERSKVMNDYRVSETFRSEFNKIFPAVPLRIKPDSSGGKSEENGIIFVLAISCLNKEVSELRIIMDGLMEELSALRKEFADIEKNKNITKKMRVLAELRRNPAAKGVDIATRTGVTTSLVSLVRKEFAAELEIVMKKKEDAKNVHNTEIQE